MFIRKDVNELFAQAVQKDQIFDYLTGQNGYEIRLNEAYMPTDTSTATYIIKKYLESNPNFKINNINNAFVKISLSPEWSWLIVFYMSDFIDNGIDFLPLDDLYNNVEKNKEYLKKDNGWICFNFAPRYNNLWDIIVNENNRLIEDGYKLPKLE